MCTAKYKHEHKRILYHMLPLKRKINSVHCHPDNTDFDTHLCFDSVTQPTSDPKAQIVCYGSDGRFIARAKHKKAMLKVTNFHKNKVKKGL